MKINILFLICGLFSVATGRELKLFVEPVDGNVLIWPGYRRLFHSIAGSPGNLTFKFVTPIQNKSKISSASLTVMVPTGVHVEEILPQYTTVSGARTEFELPTEKETQSDGGMRYTFSLDKFLEMNRDRTYASKKEISFFFEPVAFDPKREYRISYFFESNGVRRPEKEFTLKFLPPLKKAPLPKQFELQNFVQVWHLNVRSNDLLRKISLKYQHAGLASRALDTPELKHNRYIENELRKLGWRFHYQYFTSLLRYPRANARDIAIKPATRFDGSTSMTHHCPTAAFKNRELIARTYRFGDRDIRNGDVLCLDNEPFGYWNDGCFCAECLDQFAAKFKIPRDKLTKPEIVRTTYGRQWLRHLCETQQKADRLAVELYRQRFPDSKVAAYNYFFDFDNRDMVFNQQKGCPQDPRDYDEFIDYHVPSAYGFNGKLYVDVLQKQRRHLKKPVAAALSMDRGIGEGANYLSQSDTVSPKGTRLKILAAAANGGRYVVLYAGIYYDGQVFAEVAKGMHEIAMFEDYFCNGKFDPPVSVVLDSEWDHCYQDECLDDFLTYIARGLEKRVLLTIFNFGREYPVRAQLRYKGNMKQFHILDRTRGIVYSLDGKREWSPDQFERHFRVTVPAEDVCFVELVDQLPADGKFVVENICSRAKLDEVKRSVVSAINPAAELDRIRERLKHPAESKSWHNSYVNVFPDKVIVNTLSQQAVISCRSGLLTQWSELVKKRTILDASESKAWDFASGGAWSLIRSPKHLAYLFQGTHRLYTPVGVNISDDGIAKVRLGALVGEIYLEKTFIFERNAPVCTVQVTLRNLSSRTIRAAQWFRVGLPYTQMTFKIGGKPLEILPDNNFFASDFKTSGAEKLREYRGTFEGDILSGIWAGGCLNMVFNPREGLAVNVYRGRKAHVMELMMPERIIRSMATSSYVVKLEYKGTKP